jgi:hypothetical protein
LERAAAFPAVFFAQCSVSSMNLRVQQEVTFVL